MLRVAHSVEIERPVEEVWDYVHDPRNDAVWQSTLIETKQSTEPLVPGARLVEVRRFLGRRFEVAFEVTELSPHTRSAIRVVSGPFPFAGAYELEPSERGTRFTTIVELDAHGFFRLAEPVFGRMAARELRGNLEALKDVLEARVDDAGGEREALGGRSSG
jgi:hypothetical protein